MNTFNWFFVCNIQAKMFVAAVWGTLVYITGNEPKVLGIIAALWAFDLAMGLTTAIKHKTLSSDFLVDTLYKLALYILLLGSVNWFIELNGMTNSWFGWFDDLIEFLIGAAEIISILENADLLGFRYAKRIIRLVNNNVEKKLEKCPPVK